MAHPKNQSLFKIKKNVEFVSFKTLKKLWVSLAKNRIFEKFTFVQNILLSCTKIWSAGKLLRTMYPFFKSAYQKRFAKHNDWVVSNLRKSFSDTKSFKIFEILLEAMRY